MDNTEDIIDSRDVIARIEELEAIAEDGDCLLDMDERTELETLRSLASEGEGFEDWEHGTTLVRETYFTDYMRELIVNTTEDLSDLPDYISIDWDATAETCRVDYSEVEFGDVTYYIR